MKLKMLFVAFLAVFTLAGCTLDPSGNGDDPANDPNDDPKDTTELKNKKGLAYSSYLAASFLSGEREPSDGSTSHSGPLFLQGEDETMLEIEKELGEISGYFNRLKVFLDHGLDNPFTIETDLDINENYDIEMRYTVEDRTYTMLFNEDGNGNLEGVMILDGEEYALEGMREVESETDDGDLESEEEITLRTTDTDSSDYVEIEIEVEQESDEYAFEMTVEMNTDGIEKTLSVEFEGDEEETSIELETSEGNTYEFSREEDDDGIIEYYFEYTVNDTEGEVELTITQNENGEDVYRYVIEEDGEEKVISENEDDKDEPDDDSDNEDEDDETST